MTILLLGKNGQVGWQLQRSLAPHDAVVACGRIEADLSNFDQLRALVRKVKPSVIVNAAAYTAVDQAESEKKLVMLVNGEAPGVLAEEAAQANALLIHYSTDYVFDGQKAGAYVESDSTGPQNFYGISKLAGENAIAASRCKSLIFRTSCVFGARGKNFVKDILQLAREKDVLPVVADQSVSPTPAAMIATVSGLVLGILRQGRLMGAGEHRLYHLAAANPVSWHGLAQRIVEQAGAMPGFDLHLTPESILQVPSDAYPASPRRPMNLCLSSKKLEREFDLQMPDWQPYLARMLQLLSLKQNGY